MKKQIEKRKLIDSIDPHQLPIVPIMVNPTFVETHEFHQLMMDDLRRKDDESAIWALQMIAQLQKHWFDTGDKLAEIERIISR